MFGARKKGLRDGLLRGDSQSDPKPAGYEGVRNGRHEGQVSESMVELQAY